MVKGPFQIHKKGFYQLLLAHNVSMEIRFVISLIVSYLGVVTLLSIANKRRNSEPWALSRTRAFKRFVSAHNLLLTLFLAWAFIASHHVLRGPCPERRDEHYFTRLADPLCLGDSFRPLGDSLSPSGHDIYKPSILLVSWTFYVSKMYQIVDTAIILAKGRRSTALHTYHHAGVILCGWASVYFMCQPSVVGLLYNSAYTK
jgi:hypothetical protein